MCGTYNFNQLDDFTLPSHITTIDVAKFGNTWGKDRSCCISKRVAFDTCSRSTESQHKAKDECQVLRSGQLTLLLSLKLYSHFISLFQQMYSVSAITLLARLTTLQCVKAMFVETCTRTLISLLLNAQFSQITQGNVHRSPAKQQGTVQEELCQYYRLIVITIDLLSTCPALFIET